MGWLMSHCYSDKKIELQNSNIDIYLLKCYLIRLYFAFPAVSPPCDLGNILKNKNNFIFYLNAQIFKIIITV